MGALGVLAIGVWLTTGCGAAPIEEQEASDSEAIVACQNPALCVQSCQKVDPTHTLDGKCCWCNNACGHLRRDQPITPATLFCRPN